MGVTQPRPGPRRLDAQHACSTLPQASARPHKMRACAVLALVALALVPLASAQDGECGARGTCDAGPCRAGCKAGLRSLHTTVRAHGASHGWLPQSCAHPPPSPPHTHSPAHRRAATCSLHRPHTPQDRQRHGRPRSQPGRGVAVRLHRQHDRQVGPHLCPGPDVGHGHNTQSVPSVQVSDATGQQPACLVCCWRSLRRFAFARAWAGVLLWRRAGYYQ